MPSHEPCRCLWSRGVMPQEDAEIDLIIDRPGLPRTLVEIRSTRQIQEQQVTPLSPLSQACEQVDVFCLSQDPLAQNRTSHLPSLATRPSGTGARELVEVFISK